MQPVLRRAFTQRAFQSTLSKAKGNTPASHTGVSLPVAAIISLAVGGGVVALNARAYKNPAHSIRGIYNRERAQ